MIKKLLHAQIGFLPTMLIGMPIAILLLPYLEWRYRRR